jgi:septum formation protein
LLKSEGLPIVREIILDAERVAFRRPPMMSSLKSSIIPTFARTGAASRETLRRSKARERAASKEEIERPRLILASASPRRVTLLAQVGITPDALRPASIDESAKRGEMPRALVTRLAKAKAEAARDQIANDGDLADSYILAADTVVAMGRKILMKPAHIEEAMASLQLLSGRTHKVQTCVCLITPDDRMRTKIVDTRVRFRYISRSELESYIASREWRGKAGGYAIQGLAGCFVQRLIGSYTNVVGLPLTEVVGLLNSEKFPIQYNWLKYAEVDRA